MAVKHNMSKRKNAFFFSLKCIVCLIVFVGFVYILCNNNFLKNLTSTLCDFKKDGGTTGEHALNFLFDPVYIFSQGNSA